MFFLVVKDTLKLSIVLSKSSRRQIAGAAVKYHLTPLCDLKTRCQSKLVHASEKARGLEWLEPCDFN